MLPNAQTLRTVPAAKLPALFTATLRRSGAVFMQELKALPVYIPLFNYGAIQSVLVLLDECLIEWGSIMQRISSDFCEARSEAGATKAMHVAIGGKKNVRFRAPGDEEKRPEKQVCMYVCMCICMYVHVAIGGKKNVRFRAPGDD
jgi:hypothetical protein